MGCLQVLVTGGKGKTGRRVAARLLAAGIPAVVGSRTPEGASDRRFDWSDLSSAAAFDGCSAAYLVAPTDRTDHLAVMQPMLEQAMKRGVQRFVLLSSSLLEPGGPMMGEVHAWVAANTPEWAVLRPSWFMQNFSEGPPAVTIREEGIIYSATGDGRVGFIDADDIAATAVAALTAQAPLNADVILTGPEALSYADIAALVSAVIGQPIRHVQLDPADLAARFVAQGLTPDYAETLASLDRAIATGAEDRVTAGVEQVSGQLPTSFRAFAERVVNRWI
ncbi:MAG: ergot alkaloid biosynthesis protein [Alphaproteobacteria bacterium]|nr:ergot alkaloid biosynthesis protein [Alphaproteobacteria bacterium]